MLEAAPKEECDKFVGRFGRKISKYRRLHLAALLALGFFILPNQLKAQSDIVEKDTNVSIDQHRLQSHPSQQLDRLNSQAYILGPGDALVIELLDVPEYSGIFTIGPDGTIYIPRLRSLYVEGFTIEELRSFLVKQYSTYVKDPQVFVSPAAYRQIRVYIGGEVRRPGYYYLSDKQNVIGAENRDLANSMHPPINVAQVKPDIGPRINGVKVTSGLRLPTVFDALRTAGGVTPFSKLSEVTVTCKQPQSSGGRKIRTQLNFLDVITEGNESQNIRLFDGDTVVVSRSDIELREQIIKAGQTNLSPDFVEVYVTGRVRDPGSIVLLKAPPSDQALAAAGGQNYVDKLNSYASTATVVPISANSFYVRRTPQALSKTQY